jgi:uncharacterized protein YkwD
MAICANNLALLDLVQPNPGPNPALSAPLVRYWNVTFSRSIPIGVAALAAALSVFVVDLGHPDSAYATCKGKSAEPESIPAARAEQAVFCLLNRQRAKRDFPRLGRHRRLDGPSREHSLYMVENRCFDHDCPGEPTLEDRIRRYLSKDGRAWGENIAWGPGESGSPRSVVRSWMSSEGHRSNILSRQYEHIGVGVVWGNPEGGDYPSATYTTDFGARGG